jgi:hypothetical protein
MGQQTQQPKKTATKKQIPPEEITTKKPTQLHQRQSITPEERQRMIAETAYHIAQQRGFQGDKAMADWLQAEAEVDARFSKRH